MRIDLLLLVQFSSPYRKYLSPEVTLIRDQVLINIGTYDP